jgi:hypothetical protein
LSNQELIAEGTNDLLKKQQVEKIPISPISVQNIDVSINLAIGVSFLRKVCPKNCIVFQKLPLPTPWLQYKESVYFLMCFLIFSLWNFLYFLLHQNKKMSALDRLREKASKRKVELRRQKKGNKKRKMLQSLSFTIDKT